MTENREGRPLFIALVIVIATITVRLEIRRFALLTYQAWVYPGRCMAFFAYQKKLGRTRCCKG